MPTAKCAECGREFETTRSSARYCSAACKQSAYRARKRAAHAPVPVWVSLPAREPKPVPREVLAAFTSAHRVANDLGRLSVSGPYQTRAACARVASALQGALEAEGL